MPSNSRRSMGFALGAMMLGLAACSPGQGLQPLPDAKVGPYRLGVGDQVRLITFGEDQLTGDFTVGDSGTIDVPLLGAVPAAGRTTASLGAEISQELKRRKLFQTPSVAVQVTAYRPIFILGEVQHPGQFPYQPDMTVLSAVAVAGGFTYRAVTDRAAVIRTDARTPVEGSVTRQSLVEPGDVITVFERRF